MQHFIWLLFHHVPHDILNGLVHIRNKGAQIVILDQDLVWHFMSKQDELFISLRSLFLGCSLELELLDIEDFKGRIEVVKVAFEFVCYAWNPTRLFR